MSNLIIETNNNFIKDFNILQNKSGNQIEGKYSDFFNFSNEQSGNVIESIPDFELKLELYLEEPASTDKKNGMNQNIFIQICINYT
jgi:hypothetical protein